MKSPLETGSTLVYAKLSRPHSRIFSLFTASINKMSEFTTPEKKRGPSSPPVAPLRKRMKENMEPAADAKPLLLISTSEDGGIVTYCSNHPLLDGVSGHHCDILEFYSDELFAKVLSVVGGTGYSATNLELCFAEEIRTMMKESLIKLFSQDIYGGGRAADGQVFRGTIVLN